MTAFARDASKLPEREEIAVIVGDATDADAVARAVVGHDAIVVALGDSRNPFALAVGMKRITPPNICEIGTAHVIAAAQAASVQRLVCVTSYGVGDTRKLLPPMHKLIFRWLLFVCNWVTPLQLPLVAETGAQGERAWLARRLCKPAWPSEKRCFAAQVFCGEFPKIA